MKRVKSFLLGFFIAMSFIFLVMNANANAGSITLSWGEPTEYVDGVDFTAEEIAALNTAVEVKGPAVGAEWVLLTTLPAGTNTYVVDMSAYAGGDIVSFRARPYLGTRYGKYSYTITYEVPTTEIKGLTYFQLQ